MTSPKTPNRLSGRTKIITAASIGAVGLASVFAIGANLGILSSTDQTKVGTVAAAGDLLPATPQVVDVYLDKQGNPLPTAPSTPVGSQRFTVDTAGTVDVSAVDGTARVDLVTPASGWTATSPTTTGTGVSVTFTDGTRTLDFTATVAADGTVTGDVTEATAASPNPQRTGDHESDHEYEGGESDD
jgi:hypothetical protein